MSMRKKAEIIGTIESLLKAVDADSVKTAAAKKSEAYTEAGGYMGATTHPVKDVEDRTEAASEGARSAENTDDVKNEPNRGPVVDSVSAGPGAGQDSVQTNIGITSHATGEDSSAETDSAKDGKQDPGSSHPARTDNEALDGHKYASKSAQLIAMVSQLEKLGENICAWISTNTEIGRKKAEESAAGSTNSQAGGVGVADGPITTPGKVEAKSDGGGNSAAKSTCSEKISGQAGYDLAGIFANTDIATEDKIATDNMVVEDLAYVIETAVRRAEKCAEFYAAHFDPRNQKRAEGDESEAGKSEGSEGSDGSGDASAAGGGAPAPGGEGGPSPEEEQLLMQLLQGGEGMGAEGAMGEMGGGGGEGGDPLAGAGGGAPPGGDPMAAMGGMGGGAGGGDPMAAMGGGGMPPGGDPMAGGGAAPPGGDPMAAMGGGGGAGGGLEGADPAMLQQILAELGIDPSQLQQKISASRKQAQVKKASRKAKWEPKTAADRQKYARMTQVIKEITGRSRA
jgi:hypothetical protein